MYISTVSSFSNEFLKMNSQYLNTEIFFFENIYDLQEKIKKFKMDDKIYLLNRNIGFKKNILEYLHVLNKTEGNIICYTNNISKDNLEEKNDYLLKLKKNQNTGKTIELNVYAVVVTVKDLINSLDCNSKNFYDVIHNIEYSFITKENINLHFYLYQNIIDSTEDFFMINFKNLSNVKNYINYYDKVSIFKKQAILPTDIQEKNLTLNLYNGIYSEVVKIIFLNLEKEPKLLDKIISTKYNCKHNIIYIITNDRIETKNLKAKCEKIKKLDNSIIENLVDNLEVLFFDNLKQLDYQDNKTKKVYLEYQNDTKKLKLVKINSLYLKILDYNIINYETYLIFLGNISYFYLKHLIYFYNIPVFEKLDLTKEKIKIRSQYINLLYENKSYDECFSLINFMILNRITFDNSYIYKCLVLLNKVNIKITNKDVNYMVDLLSYESIDDLFLVFINLKSQNYHNISNLILQKYIEKKNLKKTEIKKFCVLLNLSGLLKKTINLSTDKYLLNMIGNNIVEIMKTCDIKSIFLDEFNSTEDISNLKSEILFFMDNRKELIEESYVKKIVNKEITNDIFDLKNFVTTSDEKILEKFYKYPEILHSACISLSDIMISTEDIEIKRRNLYKYMNIIEKEIDTGNENILKLIDTKMNIFIFHNLFKYAYHGKSNRDLFKKSISITDKVFRIKSKNTNNLEEQNTIYFFENYKTNPKKVCFIADFLTRKHSVFKDRHQVILNLIKKGFEVYLAIFSKLSYKYSSLYKGVKEVINLNGLDTYRSVIKMRSYKFDKLVFCEIGMDSRVVNLAHFRMANKQYNTWGHSDTSGFPEVDYFVSSELYELPYEQSKEHYTEKLILQKGMCTCYVNPTDCYNLTLSRSYYGLSNFEKIICCPQSLFKIHPEFDKYLFEILKKNPEASLVFLDGLDKKANMYERWNKILKDMPQYYGVLSRVKFIPSMNHEKFCNLMKVSDVMIDPYPFGGCNSSLESFSLGKPLVTQPSIRINGRFTYGFYKRMGFMDLVSNNMEEYVSLTTRLLKDKDFHQEMTDKILANKDKLFMDQQTLDEWEELMAAE